ncbi:MAG: hypothetical protein ACRETL_15965, partial [Gammaproteobacteria bacterium]
MIDDATSRLHARFARHDSTGVNMRLRWSYVERHGPPRAFYTDKASRFQARTKRGGRGENQDAPEKGADADRPRLAGVGHHLDGSAFSACQGTGKR